MKTREAFEKAVLDKCHSPENDPPWLDYDKENDEYSSYLIQEKWEIWQACDNHKEAEIAELKEKLRLHQTRLEEEREQMKTFGLILNHALQGKKHPKESDNDSRMQAIRDLREQALK